MDKRLAELKWEYVPDSNVVRYQIIRNGDDPSSLYDFVIHEEVDKTVNRIQIPVNTYKVGFWVSAVDQFGQVGIPSASAFFFEKYPFKKYIDTEWHR